MLMTRKLPRLPCFAPRGRNRGGYIGIFIFLFVVIVIMIHEGAQYLEIRNAKTQQVRDSLESMKIPVEMTYNASTTILNPRGHNVCKNNGSDNYMLMMFITAPQDESDRNYLRKLFNENVAAWEKYVFNSRGTDFYKPGDVFKMLFFVGMPDKEDTKLITEWESHGDLVVDDFQESYLNLTLKTVRMLKWVQTYCPKVKYLLKVDGDVYFNMNKLVKFLETRKESDAKRLIAGHEYKTINPDDDYNSKWYTPPSIYQGKLPNFVGGFFYVLGSSARSTLYDEIFKTPLFHLEDAFLTGFVRNSTGLKTEDIYDVRVYWVHINNYKPTCFLDEYVAVHPIPAKKLSCWAQFSNPDFKCSRWPIISYCY